MVSGNPPILMRSLQFLILTTSAATVVTPAAAQQERRAPEARAVIEARAAQTRDTIRLRSVNLEAEIERLAGQLMMVARQQAEATQGLRALTARAAEQADRAAFEMNARQLQTQLRSATQQYQLLRGRLAALCDRGAKPQGYMGITFSATMQADASSGAEVFRFDENPTVEAVDPGSPAGRAGVEKGDEILLIGGKGLVGRDVVFTELLRPGSRLPIRIRRDGEARDVVMMIRERPESLDNGCPFLDARVMAAFGEPLTPLMLPPGTRGIVSTVPMPAARGGTRVRVEGQGQAPVAIVDGRPGWVAVAPAAPPSPASLSDVPAPTEPRSVFVVGSGVNQMVIAGATIVRPNADLRDTFGVKTGLLVLDVARGTPAYASGLKGGDIIVSAGRFTATSPVVIERAMRSADDRQVQLRIIRKQKPQTLVLSW